uniref:Uncharacterized protein n=1 Tax=Vespula pensylvanica TaxID=30213 RepID=A0A834NHQ7_VESPE|nr:hypothetical protein H0235_013202 [Vespula pensylvanica]
MGQVSTELRVYLLCKFCCSTNLREFVLRSDLVAWLIKLIRWGRCLGTLRKFRHGSRRRLTDNRRYITSQPFIRIFSSTSNARRINLSSRQEGWTSRYGMRQKCTQERRLEENYFRTGGASDYRIYRWVELFENCKRQSRVDDKGNGRGRSNSKVQKSLGEEAIKHMSGKSRRLYRLGSEPVTKKKKGWSLTENE